MTDDYKRKVLKDMIKKGVVKKGHFLLTSGNHSHLYINKDAILSDKDIRNDIVNIMSFEVWNWVIEPKLVDVIVSPGNAGVPWGSIIANEVDMPFVYTEKSNGEMVLRKSFEKVLKGKNVLIVEDIVSTGSSILKMTKILNHIGVNKIYASAIWDRAGVDKIRSVYKIKVRNWKPDNCPLCKRGVELIDPKSDEMVRMNNFCSNGLTIQVEDNDSIFMWDLKTAGESYPVHYKSKIFNGNFKEFKEMNFGKMCKDVGLRISRDWVQKLDIKLKMCNNQLFFRDNDIKEDFQLNLKEL